MSSQTVQQYTYFAIWAEETADLNDNSFEWAYGNGNNTPSGTGVVIGFDCELVSLCLSTEGAATAEVEARINTSSAARSVFKGNTQTGVSEFENNPVQYLAGDVFNFFTIDGNNQTNGGVATAWFRRLIA